MRRVVTAVAVLTAVAAVGVLLLWIGQRRLLFFPSQVVPATPPDVSEVTLTTDDGLELAAWFVPPTTRAGPGAEPHTGPDVEPDAVPDAEPDARRDVGADSGSTTGPGTGPGTGAGQAEGGQRDGDTVTPDSVVIMFHGNGGNRVGRLPLARSLASRGHSVLLVDYRGYGGNPGQPTAAGLALDARAARDWAVQLSGVDGDNVVYFGGSLGAAVAIELAVEHPPAALVLRSPFTSLADVAKTHYPVVPSVLLRDRWPSLDRMRQLDVPTLVVAGSADRIVPTEQSERLYEAAAGPARLHIVEGADHNDPALLDGDQLLTTIESFLTDHVP